MKKEQKKKKREEKKNDAKKGEEKKIEEKRKKKKIDCVKERACILQTFYHKNMLKNTFNFKINFIVKLYDIFEKNSCPNCLRTFF